MSQPNTIRVLVVDDHPVVRQGLVGMLEEAPNILVVGQAGNGREALAVFRQEQPDVTLMDLRMPEMDGVAAITVVSQKMISGKVGHSKHDCSPCYDDCFSLQVAALSARDYPAQRAVVLPLLLKLPKLGGDDDRTRGCSGSLHHQSMGAEVCS